MSIAITITGKRSLLESSFQPPLNIDDKYECGLIYFSALNSIPNINESNNVFAYGNGKKIKIPCGAYDLYDIADYIRSKVTNCDFMIKPNNNTLKCSIYCSNTINFDTHNSIGSLLGFQNVKLEANKWHESQNPVNILPLSMIRVECDLIKGTYTNGLPSHILYEFVPNVPPGYRFIEVPQSIIYFPVNKNIISSINIKILNEQGQYIDFREECVHIRLHLRKQDDCVQ